MGDEGSGHGIFLQYFQNERGDTEYSRPLLDKSAMGRYYRENCRIGMSECRRAFQIYHTRLIVETKLGASDFA